MSRCFRFPPPGYEKRAIIDDTDLLTKEKHKEKRHKKDKKDNEKREGKEKKDKERSKEKRNDKKARKEEHKDKKDKDRDKEKNQVSDEKRVAVAGQPDCSKGENLIPNNLQNFEIKDSKYVQELARRIRDEDRATESRMVQKITVTGQRRYEFLGKAVENNIANHSEEKGNTTDRKVNGQKNHVEARSLENAIGQNFSSVDHRRDEGTVKPMEKKDVEKPMDGKEKNKHKESDNKRDKPKDKDREKKSKSKDKDRDKEKKRKEKAKLKEINEQSKEQSKLKESGKESLDTCNVKRLYLSEMSSSSSFGEGNLGKRKELEKNGLLHDNGIRPHKLPRLVSSSQLVMENGRKLEPSQTAVHFTSRRQGAVNNFTVDIKENRINGLIAPQRPNACSSRSSSSTVQVNGNGEASAKPPVVDAQGPNSCSTRSPSITVQVNGNGEAAAKPPVVDAQGPNSCSTKSSSITVQVNVNGKASAKLPVVDARGPNSCSTRSSSITLQVNVSGESSGKPPLIGLQTPNACPTRSSSTPLQVTENGESSRKPPHPDSKYLSQILSIPKMEEGPDFDDQEWLFSSNCVQSKECKVDSPQVEGTPQVWAAALQIESADVYALPYVIPY